MCNADQIGQTNSGVGFDVAAARLGLPSATVTKRAIAWEAGHSIGREICFREEDLEHWLRQCGR